MTFKQLLKRELKLFWATVIESILGTKAKEWRWARTYIKELRGYSERQYQRWLMRHEYRLEIYRRYGKRCLYPGCTETENIEIDHVISLWNGGKTEIENLQPLCQRHNKEKWYRNADYRKGNRIAV